MAQDRGIPYTRSGSRRAARPHTHHGMVYSTKVEQPLRNLADCCAL